MIFMRTGVHSPGFHTKNLAQLPENNIGIDVAWYEKRY